MSRCPKCGTIVREDDGLLKALQNKIDWGYVLRFIAVTIVALIATYFCAIQCGWR